MEPASTSLPQIAVILAVGYTLGRVRPLRQLVSQLRNSTSEFIRSAEALARRHRSASR